MASARLSDDRTKVYFAAGEVHPGERHFYTIPVDGGAFADRVDHRAATT